MASRRYVCDDCGARFGCSGVAKFCPSCGGAWVRADRERAKDRAQKYIAECKELVEKAEAAFNAYAEIYCEYEFRVQTLRQYKKRGIITDEQIPRMGKPHVAEKLKEYREKRKEQDEQKMA